MKTEIIVMLALCVAMAGLCLALWRRWRNAERIMRTMNVTDTMSLEVAVKQKKEIEYLRSQLRPDNGIVIRGERRTLRELRRMTFVHIWDIEDMRVGGIQRKVNQAVDEVLNSARSAVELHKRERPDGSVDIEARLYVAVPE